METMKIVLIVVASTILLAAVILGIVMYANKAKRDRELEEYMKKSSNSCSCGKDHTFILPSVEYPYSDYGDVQQASTRGKTVEENNQSGGKRKQPSEQSINYKNITVPELRDICREMKIPGFSTMRRSELIAAVKKARHQAGVKKYHAEKNS